MDTGVWWAIVHGVAKSRTQVSMQAVQPTQWCMLHIILGLSDSTPSDGRSPGPATTLIPGRDPSMGINS